ncbi:pyrroloquinoline quinone biosynthesis peptide chaperone PqqD [Paraburkholderia phenoliruptrix]|uniref:pyrroloquinoline quinone biosynthesis peptide chaperone PqqD n=1 Tax=Paraburkholderia phenoliruptrix TaxID=252970 RepID=UPI001C4F7831|nr:pyrroloquinoline quinone biosynthesis peptide chaperone PqqD [Paraburkholderia phenoliruptrix]MBW0445854.1 pyrroloquinoline quinone biosynthesis peptide chaperone PqqD [Paraburkholderia phenoliruptrix]MBW9101708.1 pyrroloquinoline quinone biosynthesis peptide chaperone PqqD [Paraburkholderia phenoliruptrix]
MNALDTERCAGPRPHLRPLFCVRWEVDEDGYVLLSPNGKVRLNPSAGEILSRCDGTRELDDIIGELEDLFNASNLATDIYRFIEHARQRGWLE